MLKPAVFINRIKCTGDELRDIHTDSSNNENFSSSPSIEKHNRRHSTKEINYPNHTSSQQIHTVPRQTNRLEDLRRIINNRINSRKLLDNLQETGDYETAIEMANNKKFTALFCGEVEAGVVSWETSGDGFLIEDAGGFYFEEFAGELR